MKHTIKTLLLAVVAATSLQVNAADPIVIGYQTGVDPSKVAQADGAYEKAIGEKLDWRRFNSGADVVTALASGDVHIGNLGSSPLAAATSRKLPLVAFLVAAEINAAEALVLVERRSIRRLNIRSPSNSNHPSKGSPAIKCGIQ